MDINAIADVVVTGLATIGTGALGAAILPKPSSTALVIFKVVRAVVDFIGANWMNAKNGE